MSELFTLGRVRLVGSGRDATATAQPKRLALLAYLALAAGGASRRDALLALFWPELGKDEGRRALRQALHYLRRVLGENVFEAEGDEVGVRTGALRCDAVDFERLADASPAAALTLYRGDFLEAFHVDDVAAEYEEWVELTRVRLRRKAASAAWAAADAAEGDGDTARALELGHRACDLAPDHEGAWRRLMSLHDRLGDRAGALRVYETLATRLAREFDAEPAAETMALAERIRTAARPAAPVRAAALVDSRPAPPDEPRAGPEPPSETTARVPPAAPGEPSVPTAAAASSAPAARAVARRPWRRALVAGLVGAAVLGAAAFAYTRTRETRTEPSLVAAGALTPRDRLLVAHFADLAGDSILAAAVGEALRVDLTESPVVSVLTPRQVRSALSRMEQSPDVALDDSLAREVALRSGVKAIVTGSVARVGEAYTVSVQLVGAVSGAALAAYRETAPDSSDLVGAVDRVSKRLRHRLGESLRELRAAPRLAEETTASLAALRKYTEGQRLVLAGERAGAIRAFEEAIALDTAFASAHSALAMVYGSVADEGRAAAEIRRAVQLQHRLPFAERTFVVGSYAYGRQDYETAIEVYRRFLERYPNDYRALNNLALVYQDRRQFAAAESVFARAAAIDSTIANLYFGIHGNQVLQGKFAESRRTLDLIARRFPGNPVLMTVEIQDAAAQQHWEDAERRAEAQIAALGDDTLSLVDPFEALALMAMTQGRLAESERLWRTHLRLSAAAGSGGRHLFGLLRRAGIELRYRGGPARAVAIVDSALARTPLDSVLPGDRPYDELARFYAAAGDVTRARAMAAAADANDRLLDRGLFADREWTRGVIALAEGRTVEAEGLLRAAADHHLCPICVLPDLARAYEAERRPQATTAVYERYITTPWLWRYEVDALELGPAFDRLAELHDAAGESTRAAAARGHLLQLWRRADPELQPLVQRARAALADGKL